MIKKITQISELSPRGERKKAIKNGGRIMGDDKHVLEIF